MIDIIMNGRLGNQLFLYAFAKKMSKMYDKEIYMNTFLMESEGFSNSLVNYNLSTDIVFYNKPLRTTKKGIQGSWIQNWMLMRYIKDCIHKEPDEVAKYEIKNSALYKYLGMYINRDRYEDINGIKKRKTILAYGYFQSEKFFSDIREELLTEYQPIYPILPHNIEKYKKICNTESVCVSVRLGDDFQKNDIYNVCTIAYFKKAISYMKEKLENPVFYIFSDKTELLREQFKDLDIEMIFETGNDPDYEKLRIMSACKHFILSNSSFSWWCQYLSQNPSKIVVAPSRWYNGDVPCDIYMKDWYLIGP